MGGSTKCFSIGDEGSMCPRQGCDRRAGTFRSELMRARTHGPHYRSRSKNYWVWWVGKNQRFWFFEPVEDSGRQMGVRKRRMTVGAQTLSASCIHVKSPLYAFTRSSLQLRTSQTDPEGSNLTCPVFRKHVPYIDNTI